MANFAQLILVIVITTLTFLVTFAAIQVFHILHEFRLALQKFNRILDHTQTIADTTAKPITAVNEFFTEVKDLVNQTQDEIIESTPDRVVNQSTLPFRSSKSGGGRRFFRRSGLPLRSFMRSGSIPLHPS